ncbi:TlpA family protein disulfide reductase [Mycobacteroides abscessus]|uniref:TlpA family protein disulfide reductase n=1 Tax=Mycobacteroides abscessus TaxID=36809 RepID=UPI00188F7FAF|nr:redoxin domain-containing protein [Mycobacteroides abscessus]
MAVLALALSVGLSGCSGTEKGETSSAPSSRLLNFTAQTLDGADFAGSSPAGKKAVLGFWASWCPTCQKEAPDLQKAATAHSDVTFVGVAAQDQVPAMRDFVTKYGLTFIQLADTDAKVWALYDVTHQPAFAFLGAEGKAEVVKSPLSGPELDKKIGQLH